jgi:uncharacterized protein YkwD
VGVGWTRVGENLAELSPRLRIADAVIDLWLHSPAHRHNLLNPQFTMSRTGIARDVRGDYSIVQIYATP